MNYLMFSSSFQTICLPFISQSLTCMALNENWKKKDLFLNKFKYFKHNLNEISIISNDVVSAVNGKEIKIVYAITLNAFNCS